MIKIPFRISRNLLSNLQKANNNAYRYFCINNKGESI